jgi:hypothetical protein
MARNFDLRLQLTIRPLRLTEELSEFPVSQPPASLRNVATETEARRICEVNPYISAAGKPLVTA